MEDVGSVFVDQDPVGVVVVVSVASDMLTLVDQQDPFPCRSETFCQNRTRKACAGNQVVVHQAAASTALPSRVRLSLTARSISSAMDAQVLSQEMLLRRSSAFFSQ